MSDTEIVNKITIREMYELDIPLIQDWLNKEHIRKWFGDPQEWYNEICDCEGKFSWIVHFIVEYNDEPIGFCQYYDCSKTGKGYAWDNEPIGTFGIDYLIGNEQFLGRGLGNKIVKRLNEIVIDKETPTQIIADPIKENIASIKVLENNGFYYDKLTKLYKFLL